MRSHLLPILAAFIVLPQLALAQETPPPSESAVELTVDGRAFSRFESRIGYTCCGFVPALYEPDDPSSEIVRYRAMLGFHALVPNVSDGLSLRFDFVPQTGGVWDIGGNGLADPVLLIHQAKAVLLHSFFTLEVGRIEMNYGDQLVIGGVGWHHIGRAFDGVRMRWTPYGAQDGLYVDGFFMLLDEGVVNLSSGGFFSAGDLYFTGLYAGLGSLLGDGLELDAYALARVWAPVDLPQDPLDPAIVDFEAAGEVTLGARFQGTFADLIDLRIEGSLQAGTRQGSATSTTGDAVDVLAGSIDAEVGLDMRKSNGFRLALHGFYASGEEVPDPASPPDPDNTNNAYNHLFPTAHKFLGLMDVVGARTHVMGGAFHAQAAFKPVKYMLDVFVFARPEVADTLGAYYGTEVNARAVWGIAKGVTLSGLYGVLIPSEDAPFLPGGVVGFDDDADPTTPDEALIPHYVEIQFQARF